MPPIDGALKPNRLLDERRRSSRSLDAADDLVTDGRQLVHLVRQAILRFRSDSQRNRDRRVSTGAITALCGMLGIGGLIAVGLDSAASTCRR